MCDLHAVFAATPARLSEVVVVSCSCGQTSRTLDGACTAAAIVLKSGAGLLSRAYWLVTLRFKISQAKAQLGRAGYPDVAVLAAWPSLEGATLVYDVATAAARYAEERMLPGGYRTLMRAVGTVAGLHPTIEVVVVVGTQKSLTAQTMGSRV